VRPQKEKHSACPFCNQQKLNIGVALKLTEQQIMDREKEEQQVNEARIRARDGGDTYNNDNGSNNKNNEGGKSSTPIKIPDSNGFGSSLERDSRVAMSRKRSESFASSEHSGQHEANSFTDKNMIQSMAMTPEERSRLEAEMRNQNLHPLTLQIEAEAQQRAQRHERAYHRSHSHSDSSRRTYGTSDNTNTIVYGGRSSSSSSLRRRSRAQSGGRDWNEIVEAFEHGGNGAVSSLDDIVILEAAILLSMEEEARHANDDGDDDDVDGDGEGENGGAFDAAGHARDGFPLMRSFLASRGRGEEPATQQQVQNLARSLNSNRRRNHLLRSGLGSLSARTMPQSALDTASLLMRGVSEEDQLAMAIAASLQDHNTASSSSSSSSNGENGNANNANTDEDEGEASETDQEATTATQTPTTPEVAIVVLAEEDDEDDHEVNIDHGEVQENTIGQPLSPEEEIPEGVTIGVVTEDENTNNDSTETTSQPASPTPETAASTEEEPVLNEAEQQAATDADPSPRNESSTASAVDANHQDNMTVDANPIEEE
jgi:hypothetical protein